MPYIQSESVNHWFVVRFNSERLTDPMTVNGVGSEISPLIAELPPRCQVAVSFEGVEAVSSQVIGFLLGLKDQIARKHGSLVLCKLGKHVQDLMRITKLERHFTLSDSLSRVVGRRTEAGSHRLSAREIQWMN